MGKLKVTKVKVTGKLKGGYHLPTNMKAGFAFRYIKGHLMPLRIFNPLLRF